MHAALLFAELLQLAAQSTLLLHFFFGFVLFCLFLYLFVCYFCWYWAFVFVFVVVTVVVVIFVVIVVATLSSLLPQHCCYCLLLFLRMLWWHCGMVCFATASWHDSFWLPWHCSVFFLLPQHCDMLLFCCRSIVLFSFGCHGITACFFFMVSWHVSFCGIAAWLVLPWCHGIVLFLIWFPWHCGLVCCCGGVFYWLL